MSLYDFSGCEFVDSIGEVLGRLEKRTNDEGIAFSGKPREGSVYIFDELRNLFIPIKVVHALNSVNWDEMPLTNEEKDSLPYFHNLELDITSISDFVESSGGLTKSLYRLEATERYYYRSNWGLSDKEDDERIVFSFIKSLYDGIQLIRTFINKKHRHRETNEPQDFCVFCWKRVRHNQERVDDLDKKRRESNSYCPEHHPTRSPENYLKAKRALEKAVKDERPEFSHDLERLYSDDISRESRAAMFNKWTMSFAPKSKLLTGWISEDIEWQTLVEVLLHEAEINYKNLYRKVEGSLDGRENWPQWFYYGVLDSLDESKDKRERIMWQTTGVKSWCVSDWKEIGWPIVLHLFRRYEAYYYVSNRRRPRGPKPVKNRPLTPLQETIQQELYKYLNNGIKPKVKDIAQTLDVAPKTVYQVYNKLK